MSTKTGRAPMRSPGRPPPRREVERAFWVKIAEGLTSEDAAVAVGVSGPVGSRWFRQRGGMPASLRRGPSSGRYLSFAEREEIALLRAQRAGVREIARRIGRTASTVSRELRRNAATRGGQLEYRASVAQWKAERAARLRRRPAGRAGAPPRRHAGARPGHGSLEGAEQAPTPRSALGDGVEPGTDRPPPADGLPR
jgi:transposase-like protein